MASATPNNNAPIRATWICLGLAWMFLLIPGVGIFFASPLCLATFILSIVVMCKGETASGLIPLLLVVFASPIVWLIGFGLGMTLLAGVAASTSGL